jgi:Cys-tRNA(Pro)/Cys-tRNA(Cys) deacylase
VAIRNNVTRLLDAKNVPYSVHELPTEQKLGALEVAGLLGLPPESVYKTIVASRPKPKKPVLALVPAPSEVDLKALASALGEKKVSMATEKEAERLTGLAAGGISALALLHKPFQVVIDDSAARLEQIYVSGGQRGMDIGINPHTLLELTDGVFAPIRK